MLYFALYAAVKSFAGGLMVSDTGTQSSIPSTFFSASALTFFVAMAKPDDAPPMTGTLNELSDIWLNNTTSGLGNSNDRTASAPAFLNARLCVVRLVASVAADCWLTPVAPAASMAGFATAQPPSPKPPMAHTRPFFFLPSSLVRKPAWMVAEPACRGRMMKPDSLPTP